jgi:hypothetical protein
MLVGTLWKGREPQLRLESKPRKKVFAIKAYDAGAIILIPYSESLVVEEVTEANQANRIETDVIGSDDKPVWISKPGLVFPKADAKSQVGSLEMFWCVRDLEEAKEQQGDETPSDPEAKNINMHLINYRVLGAMAVKPQADAPPDQAPQGQGLYPPCVALYVRGWIARN